MPDRILYIMTDDGFFGQTRKPWVSIDIGKLVSELEKNEVVTRTITFQEIGFGGAEISNARIFYTFSQKLNTRRYIVDIIQHLSHGSNHLIPSLDLLFCHENKGYQELYRRRLSLPSPTTAYVANSKQVNGLELRYPVVVKTVDGSNGNGVFLAEDRACLSRIVKRLSGRGSLMSQLDLIRRKYFRRKKTYADYPDYSNRADYEQYREYIRPECRFIVQEFIPDLRFDYRVLAMGDRYFVMKRHVLSGDFRASGTKRFDFEFTAPDALLEFSRMIHERVGAPFLSMDICPHNKGYDLLEFQALHFGISSVKRSKGFYMQEDGVWRFEDATTDFETQMAATLAQYLHDFRDQTV